MHYLCPSCKVRSSDDKEPIDLVTTPLCVFCSGRHTAKELLNWQIDHLESIDPASYPKVLRAFYRYVENSLNIQQEKLDDITKCRRDTD